jgi:transposase
MRGTDVHQSGLFSYVSLESRVPQEHPLRGIKELLDEALEGMSRDFDRVYASEGRPSIPPERLVRASTLQILYSIRSERLLCEQLDYNLLFAGSWGSRSMSRSGITRASRRTGTG